MADVEVQQPTHKGSDLPVRVASALAMLLVAGTAFWLGGLVLDLFIGLVGLIAFVEMARLIIRIPAAPLSHGIALIGAILYVGLAAAYLVASPAAVVFFALGIVIVTDTGAYFTGRAIGGPKIAPSISPSKTWAGLFGGMAAAGLLGAVLVGGAVSFGAAQPTHDGQGVPWLAVLAGFAVGAVLAIVAQMGDFFESWLKRRAGVKDSSRLIPGHGGVLDRVDGLLPVAIIVGAVSSYLMFV